MTDSEKLVRLLDELVSVICVARFKDARDVVSLWANTHADAGQPGWHEILGSGLRHAMSVAEDAAIGADMCHIRIDWPLSGRTLSWRFDAARGAAPELEDTITGIVARATATHQ